MTGKIGVSLHVNGRDYAIDVEARKSLADAIREDCGLTGTNIGCEHGVCGTCTILLDGEPVRSCLMFAVQADTAKIRTVESLSDGDGLSELQQCFVDNHALQCGYCTPGFLMLVTGAVGRNPDMTEDEIVELLSSNLCRCTGYRNIVNAVRDYCALRRTKNS